VRHNKRVQIKVRLVNVKRWRECWPTDPETVRQGAYEDTLAGSAPRCVWMAWAKCGRRAAWIAAEKDSLDGPFADGIYGWGWDCLCEEHAEAYLKNVKDITGGVPESWVYVADMVEAGRVMAALE
jgi:hypothetical protein